MTEDRFRAILDAYGADPARWPEAERAAAQAFASAHPDLVAEAAALDALLALDAGEAAPSPALRARVLGAAPNVTPLRPRGVFAGNARALAALAACAVMGVALGFFGAAPSDDIVTEADDAFGAAFGIDRGGGG